jgi:hypothetical protein
MLLKAVGQLLSTAKKVCKIRWQMPKGYWKSSKQFLKGIAGKCLNTYCQLTGKEAEFPSSYWQKNGNFCSFPLKHCISVYINKKSKAH